MNVAALTGDVEKWWTGNFGAVHGPLDTTWAGRNARNLFAWAVMATHVHARAQEPTLELELVEDERRQPTHLIVHVDGDHRVYDVDLVGTRLLRLLSEDGAVVASVPLSRPKPTVTKALAHAVTTAVEYMRATAKLMEPVS